MATVWAPFDDNTLGTWLESTRTGWTHLIYFNSLADLNTKMDGRRLQHEVDILGIVAHGDAGGLVNLGSPLTVESIRAFQVQLIRLHWYLKPEAVVTFYSCVAGVGQAGSELLKVLSIWLPGRWIVAFTVFGIVGTIMGQPGVMGYNTRNDPSTSLGLLNPSIPYTKIARNGQIVRWPAGEGP